MRQNSLFRILLLSLLIMGIGKLQAQTLQVALSPAPKVNRSTSGGTATIFFDSEIEDLSIICTEENPKESITKISDHQWFVNIDVNKDIEADGICYRNYLLKCSASAEYYLTTEEIAPNQVLYYTITLPNELEPKYLEEKAKYITKTASELVDKGDSYLARIIVLRALQTDMPYIPEAEAVLRKAIQSDNAILWHNDIVMYSSFCPDGKHIVSAGGDAIRLWDVETGKCVKMLEGHTDRVQQAISFSPDCKRVVLADPADRDLSSFGKLEVRFIRILDAKTGDTLQTLEGHERPVNTVSFSPDGKRVVSTARDGTIRLWDVATGQCIQTLVTHSPYSTSFSPNGKFIVSGSTDGFIRLWDVATGQCLKNLKWDISSAPSSENDHFFSGILSISFSPDGKRIVSSSEDGLVCVWDAATGQCFKTLKEHSGRVFHASFSPDGKRVISASEYGVVRIWDVATGQCLQTLEGHSGRVLHASFSPDGKRIVSASDDNTVRIWDAMMDDITGQCVQTLKGHEDGVRSVFLSSDGKRIVSASKDGTVRIWDALTGQCVQILKGHADGVRCASFSPDRRHVVSVSGDNTVSVWDVKTGQCLLVLGTENLYIYSAFFSPNGKFILSAGGDGAVRIWDAVTGQCLKTLSDEYEVEYASFSSDSKCIVSGSINGSIRIWDATMGQCLQTFMGHDGFVSSVSFSPDGRHVVSASSDETVRIWDALTGQCVQTLKGHSHYVYSAFFAPDGKRVVSASEDGTVRIWDVTKGLCLQTFDVNSSVVYSASFSPDGKHIISASEDGTVRIWDFPGLQEVINETRERFKDRPLTPEEKAKYNFE